jgi:hypothetical protein
MDPCISFSGKDFHDVNRHDVLSKLMMLREIISEDTGTAFEILQFLISSEVSIRNTEITHRITLIFRVMEVAGKSRFSKCESLRKYSQTRLERHRFMRYLVYSVRYFVVPINPSLLAIALYSSVITTLVYNDTKYSVPFMTL